MTDNFGQVFGYVVPCAGCQIRMIVPNPHTDVCPNCQTMDDADHLPPWKVHG